MKRNNVATGFSLMMAFLFGACASYAPSLVRLDPSGPNVSGVAKGGLQIYVDEYATEEKSQRAFDTKLAEGGVLPLLIAIENGGQQPYEVKAKDIVVRGHTTLKPLTPEEAASKAKRNAAGRALGWSLIVPIISIPIAVAASATHTSKVNKQIVEDFRAKAFPDGIITPHSKRSGFLFFELDEGQEDLLGLSLELTAKNAATGEPVVVATPLPAATFTPIEAMTGSEAPVLSSESRMDERTPPVALEDEVQRLDDLKSQRKMTEED